MTATTHRRVKVGDFVKVYQDPFTQKNYEGIGKVCRVHSQDAEQAMLSVEFRDELGQFSRSVVHPVEFVPASLAWKDGAK